MHRSLSADIEQATGATAARRGAVIQSLWSGYGEIVRFTLRDGPAPTVVVKHVKFPAQLDHPRGWNSGRSHDRKVRSYQVEMDWYSHWSGHCDEHCRVPRCYATETVGEQHLIVLEDLDGAGFTERRQRLDRTAAAVCLRWLANFHATFIGADPAGLWPVGSYWHLATRPDEWAAIDDRALREAAAAIDARLNGCRFQTLIHGDAKVANFCFSADGERVAAVDFQYVGGGCGMKDVAYFLGSCLEEKEQARWESAMLDSYFRDLRQAVARRNLRIDVDALEAEWRELFPVAQADFYRFLVGWSPQHWKNNDYSRRIAREVIERLNTGW